MSVALCDKLFPVFYMPLKTLLKIFASIVLVALMLVPCAIFLGAKAPSNSRRRSGSQLSNGNVGVKTILYWTGLFDSKTFYFGEGDVFRDCKVSACRATRDRNLADIRDFDAILFHGLETRASDVPPARSQKQKYVFVDLESPDTYALDASYLPDGFFNWTMTYRRDSDIPRAYGYVINSLTNEVAYPLWARANDVISWDTVIYDNLRSPGIIGRFEGKRRTAAWFVSNCRTAGLRDRYVEELKKYVDVDVYGKCGPYTCKHGNVRCYRMLEYRYYFYIAFENSLCEDYVTEKLYKVMSYDVVPIVYGAVNYSEFAPPGSYINVADFEGPKQLAKHLKYLIDTPEEYEKYFWWKRHFFVDLSHRVTLCKMCEILHDEKSLASSIIFDLKKWWSEGKCQDASKFLEKIIPR